MAYTTIDDPSAHFNIMLYVGNQGSDVNAGSTASYTFDGNSNLQPDWFWTKGRNYANDWTSYDSTLGLGSSGDTENGALVPSTNHAEGAGNTYSSYGYISSFDSNGFTGTSGNAGNPSGAVNRAVWGYASQCIGIGWKANGGSTTSVSESGSGDGAINACTYQANTTAGFSIIKYTGLDDEISNGQHTKVTHGLGVAPKVVIIKNIQSGYTLNWQVLGDALGGPRGGGFNNYHLHLDVNDARSGATYVASTAPDANYVYVGEDDNVNDDGMEYMMYAFAEVQGFSKFGTYKGNGSYDGIFCHTGFKPRMVWIKNIEQTEPWILYDTARNPGNKTDLKLSPSIHETENSVTGLGDAAYNMIDINSNGFKLRSNNGASNVNDKWLCYWAWAEEPFVTSTGIPATAR